MNETIRVALQPDQDGYVGRECPECKRYFKITPGTGITEPAPYHCPYCGHRAESSQFFTQDQIEYARSIALRKVQSEMRRVLKRFEGPIGPQSGFFKMSLTVKEGAPLPLKTYQELGLETHVTCETCTLRYAIYGVFAFCPDCGVHNSLQILTKNLDLALRELELAAQSEQELAEHLVGDALENAVSAFDGFGREACHISAERLGDARKADRISFQSLTAASGRLQGSWGFDLSASVTSEEWQCACRCFQKRHLLAHKMGVVDDAYLRSTGDAQATIGRKISVTRQEVKSLIEIVRKLGAHLFNALPGLLKSPGQQPQ